MTYTDQLSAAQRHHDNAAPCDSEAIEARIDRLVEQYRNDPEKLREAEEWTFGTFDDEHGIQVSLALYALNSTHPDDLPGTELMTTLYRLAKVHAKAIDDELRQMATVAAEAEAYGVAA